jgi:hypothetical protein
MKDGSMKETTTLSTFTWLPMGGKEKNTIISLTSDNGEIEGDDNLLKHATDYYKELFGYGVGNAFALSPEL